MANKERTFVAVLSGVLTSLTVYVAVRLWSTDVVFSVLPGWHTTIYPSDVMWTIATIIILTLTLMVYLIFKLIVRLFLLLRIKA